MSNLTVVSDLSVVVCALAFVLGCLILLAAVVMSRPD
jgi:hypothetical protein